MKITVKGLHIDIKRGATVQLLMEKYGIGTPEELFEIIRRVTPGNADKFERLIKANQKKSAKKSSQKLQTHVVEETPGEVERAENTTQLEEDAPPIEEEVVPIARLTTERNEKTMSLQQLLDDQQTLSDWCVRLELEHKEMAQRRLQIVKELAKVKNVLTELQRLLKANETKVEDFLSEYNDLAIHMAQTSTEISSCKEVLEEVRQQIEEAQKVKILVYSEGVIESEDGEIPIPAESDVAELMTTLVQRPEAEELTIKEIKTVAKVILIVKVMDQKFELEFDSERVQKFYEAVSA